MTEFRITVNEDGSFDLKYSLPMDPHAVSILFTGLVDWVLDMTPNTKPEEIKQMLHDIVTDGTGKKPKKFTFPTIHEKVAPSSSNGQGSGFLNHRSGFKSL